MLHAESQRSQTPPDRGVDPAASQGADALQVQSQLASLAEKTASDPAGWRPMLEYLRSLLNARAVALVPLGEPDADEPSAGSCIVTARGTLASSVANAIRSLAETQNASVVPVPELGEGGWMLAVPVRRESKPARLLVAQLVLPDQRDVKFYIVILQTLAGFILYSDQRATSARLLDILAKSSGLMDIFRRAGAEGDFTKACRIAADDLRSYLGCERVAFGTASRGGVRIRAISGVGKIDHKSTSHQPDEEAMKEGLLAGKRCDFSAGSNAESGSLALEILQQKTSASHLTVIPLPSQVRTWNGVVLFEWGASAPPTPATLRLVDAAEPFLPPLFDLLERARPNPVVHLARSFWKRASRNRRRAAIVAAAALFVLMAWPVHYRIKADCRLVPTVRRVVAAPFTGELREALVRPGDKVAVAQTIAEMDNRDLKFKEAELIASRDRALKMRDRAMSNAGEGPDYAQSQVAQFEARSVEQDLLLVQRRIAMLEVKSPIDGVIVAGDLERARGVPVQQGQVLFEVAPLDAMIVEIDVPDREISRAGEGMRTRFRLDAFGGRRWSTTIDRIHPQSDQRDTKNVFICEAPIPNLGDGQDLRPGMRGRAVIEGGRRPLFWVLTHRFWDFLVTTLFW